MVLDSVLPSVGSALATLVSSAVHRDQLRRRSWSIALATLGNWLAFCTTVAELRRAFPSPARRRGC